MNEWWAELAREEQVFYGIAIVSSLVMFIQLVLTLIGAEFDSPDGDFELEGGDGDLGVLSIRTICAFFVGFGWGGLTALKQYDATIIVASGAGFLTGSIFLFGVLWTMRALHSLKDDGTVDIKNAIGKVGSVYLPIPPNREGTGQIQVMIQGRERTVIAITDSPAELDNRERVTVVDLIDQQTILVAPISLSGTTGGKTESSDSPSPETNKE